MALTNEQIENGRNFHSVDANGKCHNWRRNGATKRWKRNPDRFEIPIKYGLYSHTYLNENNQHLFHAEEDCPNNA